MKVLVIGGTGPTGPHIVNGQLARGHQVTMFHRGTHENDDIPSHVEHIHGDPHFLETITASLGERTFDLTIATYGRLRLLAQYMAGRTARFIGVGATVGYRGYLEATAMMPTGMAVPTAEDGPLVPHALEARFAFLVGEAERAVLQHHPNGTLFRYPLVYGPHQLTPREWCIARRALDRRPFIVLPDGGLPVITRGYAPNLAHAVLLAVDQPDVSAGQIYNCGDEQQFTLRQLAEVIASACGHQWEIVSMPNALAWPAWPLLNEKEAGWHRLVDLSKIRRELGYKDLVAAKEGMEHTVHWYAQRRADLAPVIEERLLDPFDYAAEDRLVADWRCTAATFATSHPAQAFYRPHPYAHPKNMGEAHDHRGR